MADTFKIIGEAKRRVDGRGKVTGKAKFAEDYNVAHQLWGTVVRSSHPHALIKRIDVSRAVELDGVEAVLTAKDIPGSKMFGIVVKNQQILAEDRVRYLGDGIVLIAARTRTIAETARELVTIEYELLPVVSDPEEALKPGAPAIHGTTNEFVHHHVQRGDPAKGFAEADFIIEKKFRTQFIEHSYIEPEGVLAEPAEQGGVKITGSVQNL